MAGWIDDLQGDRLYGPDGAEVLPRTAGTHFTSAPVAYNPATHRREVDAGTGGSVIGVSSLFQLWAEDFDEVGEGWFSGTPAGIAFDSVATNLVVRTFELDDAVGFTHFLPAGVTRMRISFTYRPEEQFVSSGSFTVRVAAKGVNAASWPSLIDHQTLTLPVASTSTDWVSAEDGFDLSALGITDDNVASFDLHLTARSETKRLLALCTRVEFT
jgi:hypothetical protein